jgi:hypothetical protein
MLTDHLGEVTEVGIKFSIDGNSLAYYDIFIYLSIFYIVLVFSLPVFISFGASISLIYLPSVMGISIYLTFLSLEVISGNMYSIFEFDPKVSDFLEDFMYIYLGVKMASFVPCIPYYILSAPIFIAYILITSVLVSSGSFKVLIWVFPVRMILWVLSILYECLPDLDRMVVIG